MTFNKNWWIGIFLFAMMAPVARAEWVQAAENIMGTRVTLEFWNEEPAAAQPVIDAVLAQMRAVDAQLSPYKSSSELSRVNAAAADEPVAISENFFKLLEKSLYYSRISDGAFDITFASVGRLYDYRQQRAPSDADVAEKLPAIDYRLVELDAQARTVHFGHPEVKIDLGGIAKGYAVDRAIGVLREHGVSSAIVTAGGDSRILGDRRGTPWMIGVKHPRKPEAYAVRVPVQDSAFSTSGDYERFFQDGEVRIHHIIDPESGRSASEVVSVSILAPQAVDSDALSTTVFVLGVKRGLELVNGMAGVDAIVIDGGLKLHYSEGLLRAAQ